MREHPEVMGLLSPVKLPRPVSEEVYMISRDIFIEDIFYQNKLYLI